MISKPSKGTGASGGHGMGEINVSIEYLMDSELYHDYKGGPIAYCPHCGEKFSLSSEHSHGDSIKLSSTLQEYGCPFCNATDLKKKYNSSNEEFSEDHLRWYVSNVKKFQAFDFEVEGGKVIKTYRKPHGWKPLTKKMIKDSQGE